MSEESKNADRVGGSPDEIRAMMGKGDDQPTPNSSPKPQGKPAAGQAPKEATLEKDELDPDDLDDELNDDEKAAADDSAKQDEKDEKEATQTRGRPANSAETLAGLFVGGAKMAGKGAAVGAAVAKAGGAKATERMRKRAVNKQHNIRIKKLETIKENTAAFQAKMDAHKAHFGALADNANARFNDPKMASKYPDVEVRKRKSAEMAAKAFAGPDGDMGSKISEFNQSYSELRQDMAELLDKTLDVTKHPYKYEGHTPDMAADIELVMENASNALNDAKTVKDIVPGEDENLQKGLKEKMEELEKQLRAFLDKIRQVLGKVMGR